jgi:hypothetical protein
MITELVNGYNVTGNHGAGAVREYHVCDLAGNTLAEAAGKVLAIAAANAREPGDVPEPVVEEVAPEPVVEEVAPEPVAEEFTYYST